MTDDKVRTYVGSDSRQHYTVLEPDRDYILSGRTWFTVGEFSVLLNPTHEGLIVDVYELGSEDGDCIDTLSCMNPSSW